MEEIFPHEYIRVCVWENNYVDFILGNLVMIYIVFAVSPDLILTKEMLPNFYIAHNLDFTAY